MVTLLLDSDGLIKLTKSGLIERIVDVFKCFIAEAVFQETVVQGKDQLYEDAFKIEDLIAKKKLRVKSVKVKARSKILRRKTLGPGEESIFYLFSVVRPQAIITDDRVFLNLLSKSNLPFVIPSDLIVRLVELKILEKEQALKSLKNIRPYIREYNYTEAVKALEVE